MSDDLRQIVEDNFRLVGLSLREQAHQGNELAKQQHALSQRHHELARQMQEMVQGHQELADGFKKLANTQNELADRLDEAIEALHSLGSADAQHNKKYTSLEERIAELEAWRRRQEAS